MPVSHSHRFIFIHIPKTAGTSLTMALASHGVEMEFEGPTFFDLSASQRTPEIVEIVRRSFPNDPLLSLALKHVPSAALQKMLPSDVWNQYFKFCFVRNPWDRLVSAYHWVRLNAEHSDFFRQRWPDIVAMVRRSPSFATFVSEYSIYFADMSSYVTDDSGEMMVDYVARFEDLESALQTIASKIGLSLTLPHENRTQRENYREYYTEETKVIVERYFARDIERFGYSF